jgi:thioredoxin 1
MMAPILDELSDELDSKLKIVKVDVENPESGMLQHQYEIRGIPNMKLFKKGKVVHEIIGFRNKDILEQELKEFIGK